MVSRQTEATRQTTALDKEKQAIKTGDDFKKKSTGASLSLTGEHIDLRNCDGDGLLRTTADAGIGIRTPRMGISMKMDNGTLIEGSRFGLHTEHVDISTSKPSKDGKMIESAGSVRIASKDIKMEAVDYEQKGKTYTEKQLAADSRLTITAKAIEVGTTNPTGVEHDDKGKVTKGEYKAEGDVIIPYVCAEPTYVYIYNGTPTAETARMDGIFRGKKVSIVVKVSMVSVEPDLVQKLPTPGADALTVKYLGAGAFTVVNNVVRVNDLSITAVQDGLFKGVKARLFDLSNTSIDGTTVSRSRGAFEGVPDDAFIYLPAGNTADEGEPNVVIGAVCENMQLDGNSNSTSFVADMDFSANVTLNREFTVGQTSTIYLPFAVSKEEAAALGNFYTFKTIDSKGDAVLEEVLSGLEANTPYIYRKTTEGKSAQFANVKVTQLPTTPITGATLIGTYEYKEFTAEEAKDYLYGYAANADAGAGVEAGEFVRIAAGAFIKPYRAYLKLESDAGARIKINLGGDDGDVTGIADATVHTQAAGQPYFSLSGQRVKAPQRGLYIQDSRKIVVK